MPSSLRRQDPGALLAHDLIPEFPAEIQPHARQKLPQRVQEECDKMLSIWCSLLPPEPAPSESKPKRLKGVTQRI